MSSSRSDSVIPGTYYGLVTPQILSLPIERIAIPGSGDPGNTAAENEQHFPERAIVHDGITVKNGRRYVRWREAQPSYRPFNPALLADLRPHPPDSQAQPGASSIYPNVGSDADHGEQRSQASLKSLPVGSPSPNSLPSNSGEQDANPFRRARMNPHRPVLAPADDTAQGVVRQANLGAATPEVRFPAFLSGRNFTMATDDKSFMGRPSAEVDPDDYGYVSYSSL